MSRYSRNSFPNGFFHIMVQGINKSYIFNENDYKKMYLKIINEHYNLYDISIIAYCIMGNHTHFIIFTKNIYEISAFMHKINMLYAQMYNNILNRTGYVFRDRFKSEYIDNLKYLSHCIRYIHLNPVNARIVSHEGDYDFSSFHEYNGKKGIVDFKPIENIIELPHFMDMLNNLNELHTKVMDVENNNELSNLVKHYLYENNTTIADIKNDRYNLYHLVCLLYNNKYKQKEIADILELSPNKISRLINSTKYNANKN